MSNNKQSMKLYTEEQVKEIYFKGLHNGRLHIEGKCSNEIELLTPIEIPSDEEIGKKAFDDFCDGQFIDGAKWMRDKIQRGKR
jgi:hypothetical protein